MNILKDFSVYTTKPKILLLGRSGILGAEFLRYANSSQGFDWVSPSSEFLNIENLHHFKTFLKYSHFDIIINCVAFTDVCAAENPYLERSVNLLNVELPFLLAQVCKEKKARLVHFSTDYVFNGISRKPYKEYHTPDPVNAYGKSKLAGELAIRSVFEDYYIIRTSSLYSSLPNKKKDFVARMRALNIPALKNPEPVVINQINKTTPTNAFRVANNTMHLLWEGGDTGIYHMTAEGECTWYEFAKEIFTAFNIKRTLANYGEDYQEDRVNRPQYSVLENARLKEQHLNYMEHWKVQFLEAFKDVI